MGVKGLLPLLKPINNETHINHFSGQTIGVDGYAWLHRAAISCSWDLAYGTATSKYVEYFEKRLELLISNGVTPFIVFDGGYLPSKQRVEKSRLSSRSDALQKGFKLAANGNKGEAYKYFMKAIDITPAMVTQVINLLIRMNIRYVVAPYEADAQLVYLEKINEISAIISEDSDLLIFGCKILITKMDNFGHCIVVSRDKFCNCPELRNMSDSQLRAIAIFSGCDYSPGIPSIGLKKASKYIMQYQTPERALRCMRADNFCIPEDFDKVFEQADLTFQFQRVYSMHERKVVMLNDPCMHLSPEAEIYIGKHIEDDTAQLIAAGYLDPLSHQPLDVPPNKQTSSTVVSSNRKLVRSKTLSSFFQQSSKASIQISNKSTSISNSHLHSSPIHKTASIKKQSFIKRRANRVFSAIDNHELDSILSKSFSPASSQSTILDESTNDSPPSTLLNSSSSFSSQSTDVSTSSSSISSAPSSQDAFVSKFFPLKTQQDESNMVITSDDESDEYNQTISIPSTNTSTPSSITSANSTLSKYLWTPSMDIKFGSSVSNISPGFKFKSPLLSQSNSLPASASFPKSRYNSQNFQSPTPNNQSMQKDIVSSSDSESDPDSDSESSEIETPKKLRVYYQQQAQLKKEQQVKLPESPTRSKVTRFSQSINKFRYNLEKQ